MKGLLHAVSTCIILSCTVNTVLAQENSTPAEDDPIAPGLHARLYDSYLEELSEKCVGKEQKLVCTDEFWEIADISGDGELSIAEITRILRIVSGKAAYQEYADEYEKFQSPLGTGLKYSPPESRETVVVLGVATVGPVLSHALMGNFDYNDNGLLSKAEVLHDLVEDIPLSSVDTLPSEIRSHALDAIGLILQFLTKKN